MSKRILVISLASLPEGARPTSPLSHGSVQAYAAGAAYDASGSEP